MSVHWAAAKNCSALANAAGAFPTVFKEQLEVIFILKKNLKSKIISIIKKLVRNVFKLVSSKIF